MTELNNIDDIKGHVIKNAPIEEKLHVITVVSNPCNFKIKYKLTNEFMKRMETEPNVIVYLVELVYGDQPFEVTKSTNKRHLQVRTDTAPLWHKENMINLGVRHLLPPNWKAMAWIDADIEFDSTHWALDTLKVLNCGRDFVQLFSHCIDMDFNKQIMNTFTSFGYQYTKNFKKGNGQHYWHPGFAWACNRKAYDKMGGIFEEGILGSADNIMCHTFIKKAQDSLKKGISQDYFDFVVNFQNKMQGITLGYIPGSIRHFFHGKKENRNYYGREDILIKYQFNPYTFIEKDSRGLLIPTKNCPKEFLDDIMDYFKGRNEDEIVLEEIMSNEKNNKSVLEYKINFILHEFEKLQKRIGSDEADIKKATREISNVLSINTNNTGDAPEIVPTINNIDNRKNTTKETIFKSKTDSRSIKITEIPGIKFDTLIKTAQSILQNQFLELNVPTENIKKNILPNVPNYTVHITNPNTQNYNTLSYHNNNYNEQNSVYQNRISGYNNYQSKYNTFRKLGLNK